MYRGLVCLLVMCIGAVGCEKHAAPTVATPVGEMPAGAMPAGAIPAEAGAMAPAGGTQDDEPQADEPQAEGPSFEGFDFEGLPKRFEGAWVISGVADGKQAWSIRGTEITIYDGETETVGTFAVSSPCSVEVSKKDGEYIATSTYSFAFEGDVLYAGRGHAGVRNKDVTVGCLPELHIVTQDDCRSWQHRRRGWRNQKANCEWRHDEGRSHLTITSRHGSPWGMDGTGDVLMGEHLRANPAERASDFAAAKQKVK